MLFCAGSIINWGWEQCRCRKGGLLLQGDSSVDAAIKNMPCLQPDLSRSFGRVMRVQRTCACQGCAGFGG